MRLIVPGCLPRFDSPYGKHNRLQILDAAESTKNRLPDRTMIIKLFV